MKIKNIDEMNTLEIGKYLNTGSHNHPLIIRHGNGCDIHYSEGERDLRKYCIKQNLTLEKAIKIFKSLLY